MAVCVAGDPAGRLESRHGSAALHVLPLRRVADDLHRRHPPCDRGGHAVGGQLAVRPERDVGGSAGEGIRKVGARLRHVRVLVPEVINRGY